MPEYSVTKFIDQWTATLTQELSAAGSTAYVAAAKAALLPNASGQRGYTLTLDDGDGNIEVVHCTNADGGTGALSLWRNRWGTTSQIWPVGTTIELRIPAGTLNHHMLRCPIAVDEMDYSTFDDIKWSEWTSTHLILTANIPTVSLEAHGSMDAAMAGLFVHDLLLQQDATGGRTAGWPSSVHWAGGTAPVMSTGADRMDVFRFYRVLPAMSFWAGVVLAQDIPG